MKIRSLRLFTFSAHESYLAEEKQPAASPDLSGVLLIQRFDDKRFIYVVDPKNPLRFRGSDGREIRPGRMFTDGGSIPRLFWSVRGFSPWGYAPAYVMHDWLFISAAVGRTNRQISIRSNRPTRSSTTSSTSCSREKRFSRIKPVRE